jgi:putative addiction module CopG family antidote
MNVSIGDRFKNVIAEAVESGNYTSAEDVVTEAMLLFAKRHEDYMALKASIAEALANPIEVSEEDIDAALAAVDERLLAEGYE